MSEHDEHDGYTGPATVVVDGEEVTVEVLLRSRHEPFDGRVHWSGRVRAHSRLAELVGGGGVDVLVRTDGRVAGGRLAEPDPWGRYRITGAGLPPFPVDDPPPPESD